MFGSTYIEVNILPIFISVFSHQSLSVVRIHVSQVVSTRPSKTRHRVEFKWEDGFVVNEFLVYHSVLRGIPSPTLGVSQWRLACFGGLISFDLGQFEWQALFWNDVGHSVFVVHREWFAPITLT